MVQADLRNTDVHAKFDEQTKLMDARFEGANLLGSGLTQSQLEMAWIDENTVSPGGLSSPEWWLELLEASNKRKREWERLVAEGRLRLEDY